jgi:hypothetical protein
VGFLTLTGDTFLTCDFRRVFVAPPLKSDPVAPLRNVRRRWLIRVDR